MKKTITILLAVLVVAVLSFTIIACDNYTGKQTAEAKRVALAAVGATEADAEYAVVHTTAEGNKAVEFVIDGVKYNAVLSGTNALVSFEINDRPVDINEIPAAPKKESTKTYIEKSEAKAIALADAGVDASITVYADVDWDYCDGQYLYEVEFTAPDGTRYDYEINAVTGAIHKKEVNGTTVGVPTIEGKTFLTVEEVKGIILNKTGVSAEQATFTEVHFDYDHGTYVYEVEVRINSVKYEYEINAETGAIILDDDYIHTEGGVTTGEEANQIKNIALAHAGLTAEEVTFIEIEVDMEWGVKVYKVEFVSGNYEYEYEINAETGKVIDAEKELRGR